MKSPRAIAAYTKSLEMNFAKSDLLVKLCRIYYRNIVKNEVKLAGIRSCDKILCIGGGPIPCTAIEMANQTRAKVHVIDLDCNAVECARRIVSRLGLEDQIVVEQGKGEKVDVEPYNVFHVALQVSPKEEVLDHLWSNSKAGDRILVRMPKKELRAYYSNVSDSFLQRNSRYIKSYSMRFKAVTLDKILLLVKG